MALDFLVSMLEGAEFAGREAAFRLAHFDLSQLEKLYLWPLSVEHFGAFPDLLSMNQLEEIWPLSREKAKAIDFQLLAKTHPDPEARFWLSLGVLIHLADLEPLIDLINRLLAGELELPLLWGNPLALASEMSGCGQYPDDFLPLLFYLQGNGQLALTEGFPLTLLEQTHTLLQARGLGDLEPLVEALIDDLETQAAPADQAIAPAAPPAAPWEGSPEALVARLYQENDRVALHDLPGILALISAGQKTAFISAWFAELEKRTTRDAQTGKIPFSTGVGNPIMGLPGWFWQDFEPDLAQLVEIYLRLAPERGELMQQLAWVISRAGMQRLLDETLPLLSLLEPAHQPALLLLIEQAAAQAAQAYGPLFGAGGGTPEAAPPIDHFIDQAEQSREVGSEGESMSIDFGDISFSVDVGEPGLRFVQAQVFDNSDPAAPQKLERAFLAGRAHLLNVWIGELLAGAIAAPGPIDLSELPDLPNWELQVYFWEPNHAPAIQVDQLTVYRDQLPGVPLSTCAFAFTPRPDLPDFQGRLAVVYKRNVLQMLFLEARVLANPDSASEDDQIRFQWAEVKGLSAPEQLDEFDLVFYNESDPVQGDGLVFFGGQVGLKSVSGLGQGIRDMITVLREAGAPGESTLESRKEALVILANQGSMLYSTILEQIGPTNDALLHLRDARRLQLVSAVRDVFPLEMVYVFPPPNPDAGLCPNAAQAIQTGACPVCDKLDVDQPADTICPLGFLGLRCIIERHAIQPLPQTEASLDGKDYHIRVGLTGGAKALAPLESRLFAASANVSPGSLKKLNASIQALYPSGFEFAKDWQEWQAKIKNQALLILIPHTLRKSGIPTLEIGSSTKWLSLIKEPVVRASKEIRPVVLLIGCETAVPEAPYQSFAAAFAQNGAAITVVTLSPVHELRAAPITEILLKQIQQSSQLGQTFSEALLQARRTAMAEGYAEALTLVADGDADWVLVKE